MKFAVSRESLLRPLQLVAGVVERRQTMPVLSNLLLSVSGSKLLLTGTDLEVQLSATITLDAPADEDGEVTLPARKLLEIWRALPDGADVRLALEEDRAVLRSGSSRFQLATLPAADFPAVEEGPGALRLRVAQAELGQLINRTAFSMAQQDVRYFLNGMLLEVTPEHVRSVATDGHRLAMCTMTPGVETEPCQVIVPRKGVNELSRLLGEGDGEAQLTLGSNHLTLEVAGFSFVTKLVDGRFPDYEKVIPWGGQHEIIGDRRALREAFSRTAILSNEKFRGVRLSLSSGLLKVQANNPEQEEAEEEIEVQFQGADLEMGFNVSYLQDVLNALETDEVRITVSDANSSALIESAPESSGAVYVVMPMRL